MAVSTPNNIGSRHNVLIDPRTNNNTLKKESKDFIDDKVKSYINIGANGAAIASNLLAFLNGNFNSGSSIQEYLEKASVFLTKCSTAAQGFVNFFVSFKKKNIVSTVGAALEIPIAVIASGFNLFLARGISGGMNQFDSIMSRIKDKKEGWIEMFKNLCGQIPKLTKELYKKPFLKDGIFPRTFFACSTFMILGPLIYLTGLKHIGAGLRDFFGGVAGISLITDKEPNQNNKNGITDYAKAGIFWVVGAILDYLKRLSFFTDKINNLSEISLCLDRLGAMFYTFGNMGKTQTKAL